MTKKGGKPAPPDAHDHVIHYVINTRRGLGGQVPCEKWVAVWRRSLRAGEGAESWRLYSWSLTGAELGESSGCVGRGASGKERKKKRGGEVGIGTTPVLSSMPTLCEAGLRAYDIGTTQLQDTRVEAGKQANREAGKLESWLLSSS